MALEIERSIEEREDDLSLLSQYVSNADINSESSINIDLETSVNQITGIRRSL